RMAGFRDRDEGRMARLPCSLYSGGVPDEQARSRRREPSPVRESSPVHLSRIPLGVEQDEAMAPVGERRHGRFGWPQRSALRQSWSSNRRGAGSVEDSKWAEGKGKIEKSAKRCLTEVGKS